MSEQESGVSEQGIDSLPQAAQVVARMIAFHGKIAGEEGITGEHLMQNEAIDGPTYSLLKEEFADLINRMNTIRAGAEPGSDELYSALLNAVVEFFIEHAEKIRFAGTLLAKPQQLWRCMAAMNDESNLPLLHTAPAAQREEIRCQIEAAVNLANTKVALERYYMQLLDGRVLCERELAYNPGLFQGRGGLVLSSDYYFAMRDSIAQIMADEFGILVAFESIENIFAGRTEEEFAALRINITGTVE
ncbi:hypothetical protein COV82_04670 [Candidatus Peregrinibacteria bacterium CG11_big_fil_rev_8_21_14_0_20_46_8]|nr:MAG: hypothetical protein COV82_04670 [Candidatus Peregrinibacteria bacterium CG11_big_fil_rev_8_21_14_0_20_46_8]